MTTTIRVCPLCRLPHNSAIRCRDYRRAILTVDSASVLQLQQALKAMSEKQGVQDVLPNPTSGGTDPIHSSSD